MKEFIKKIPILNDLVRCIYVNLRTQIIKLKPFQGSKNYWEKRYSAGGNSGVGSYGQFAEFKAEVINNFVAKCGLRSVIEFGCGDGNQLTLAKYPTYLGFDVSKTSVLKCQKLFSGNGSKFFRLMADYRGEKADVSLSLDVIYHLVEDDIFENYMMTLFNSSNKYVIIYASDSNNNLEQKDEHVRHRKFTVWIKKNIPQWRLIEHIPNKYPYKGDYKKGSFSDFFIYTKV